MVSGRGRMCLCAPLNPERQSADQVLASRVWWRKLCDSPPDLPQRPTCAPLCQLFRALRGWILPSPYRPRQPKSDAVTLTDALSTFAVESFDGGSERKLCV